MWGKLHILGWGGISNLLSFLERNKEILMAAVSSVYWVCQLKLTSPLSSERAATS